MSETEVTDDGLGGRGRSGTEVTDDGLGGVRYTSLAVLFCITPIPFIWFSSLFISMTRILACGGIFLCDISLGDP